MNPTNPRSGLESKRFLPVPSLPWQSCPTCCAAPACMYPHSVRSKTSATERKMTVLGSGKHGYKAWAFRSAGRLQLACQSIGVLGQTCLPVSSSGPAEKHSTLVSYKVVLFCFFNDMYTTPEKKFKESFLEKPERIAYNISLNFNETSKCLGLSPASRMEITLRCWEACWHSSAIIKPSWKMYQR